jgi:hypothetical protein
MLTVQLAFREGSRVGLRPPDWSVVGYGSDPVPGDPVTVRAGGINYRQVADRISSVVATLRGLSDDQSDARSVDVVIEQKDQVADSIEKAEQRYRAAGDALVEYAEVLDNAQASSAHALSQAQAARKDADQQRKTAQRWGKEARQATDADERARYRRFQRQAEGNAADHEAMVGVWRRAVEQASRDVDVAAQRACDQINAVTGTDGLNDSWWDNLASVLEAVAALAETISAITGILGMLLAWVPILGPALLAVSAITGVIAAIANVALAAGGKQSWGDALKSVFFAAIGCLGLGGLKGILGSIKGLALFGKTAKNAGGIAKFLKTAAVAGVKDFAHNAKTLFTGLKNFGSKIKNLHKVEFRNRISYKQPRMEKNYGHALDPMSYVMDIVKQYGINLRGSGRKITIEFSDKLHAGNPGRVERKRPDVIQIAHPEHFGGDPHEIAKTVAHELHHAREYLKGINLKNAEAEKGARAAEAALDKWLNGEA